MEDFGYLALDIETTGRNHHKDKCFAFGYAHGTPTKLMGSGKYVLDLQKGDRTWKEVWTDNMFESRCYDEFWSDHTDILDSLQQSSPMSEKDMVAALNEVLYTMEKTYSTFTILFDTVCFDSVWLELLLTKYDYPGMLYFRNGKYHFNSSYDIDSYIKGLSGTLIHYGRDDIRKRKNMFLGDYVPMEGAHDPENDAIDIYNKFMYMHKRFELLKYCE